MHHHIITVYNDMFDHTDSVMKGFATENIQWKEDLYFTVKFAQQTLSTYYSEVTPTTDMLLISGYILDPFWMF